MRIAVLGINYYPEITGISAYTTEMCEYLVKKGHDISVFTGFPYYPFGEDFSGWYNSKGAAGHRAFLSEEINGVKVNRVNFYKPKHPGVAGRIFHELSFFFAICERLIFSRGKYDIVICISPPLLLGIAAFFYSRLKRIKFIFHIQDMQPDSAVELGMITNRALIRLLRFIESFIYRKANFVLTISDGMHKKLLTKRIPDKKCGIFYNWIDTDEIRPLLKKNRFSDKYGIAEKFVVLHGGNMGTKQDMDIIINAAHKLRHDKEICFLLVGRGVKRHEVEKRLMSDHFDNIILLDSQPKELFNEMLSSCDVSLITQCAKVKNIVMPSKVFGPASASRAIIVAASNECEISRITREYNFGVVVPAEDTDALIAAIYMLKKDAALAAEMGKNGRAFMEKNRKKDIILDDFEKRFLK